MFNNINYLCKKINYIYYNKTVALSLNCIKNIQNKVSPYKYTLQIAEEVIIIPNSAIEKKALILWHKS